MPCHLSHLLKFAFHQDKFRAAQIERIFANLADLSCNEKRALRTARKLNVPIRKFWEDFQTVSAVCDIYIHVYAFIYG